MEMQLYEASLGDHLGYQGNVFIVFSMLLGVWLGGWLWLVWLPVQAWLRAISFLTVVTIVVICFSPAAHAQVAVATAVSGVNTESELFRLLSKPVTASVIGGVGSARVGIGAASAVGRLNPLGLALTVGQVALAVCLSEEWCLKPSAVAAVEPLVSGGTQPATAGQGSVTRGFGSTWGINGGVTGYSTQSAASAAARASKCGTDTCYQRTDLQTTTTSGTCPYGWSLFSTGSNASLVCAAWDPCPEGTTAGTTAGSYGTCTGTIYTCPAGWLLAGTQCVAEQAYPPDGNPTYRNNGGTPQADNYDPDMSGRTPPSPTVQRSGTDQYGNPSSDRLTSNADGSVTYQQSVQTTVNGQSYVTTNVYNIGSDGTVKSAQSQSTTGTMDAPGATPTSLPTQLPTDYARESTLQDIRTNTSGAGVPTGGGAYDTATAAVDAAHSARTGGLSDVTNPDGKDTSWGLSLDLPTPACEPFPLWDDIVIQWCPYVEITRQITGWLWGLTTVWWCFGMVGVAMRGGA